MNHLINETKDFLYSYLNQADYEQVEIDYRYEHSLRVANIGLEIAEKEKANKKVVVLACLLHDVGKFECHNNKDHGRLSAEISRVFLSALNLTEKEISDICYSIAKHVDGKAGYDYDDILEAKVVTDADNVDRYSSSKILQTKLWSLEVEATIEEHIEYYKERINTFLDYQKKQVLQTSYGNELFNRKLDLNIHFYNSLIEDLKITKIPTVE